MRRTTASSPSIWTPTNPPVAMTGSSARVERASARLGVAPSDSKIVRSVSQVSRCLRPGSGGRRQPAELEVAEPGLIALAQQVEHADALAEVVIRLGLPVRGRVKPAAQPQEFSPCSAETAGTHIRRNHIQPLLSLVLAAGRHERLDGNQFRLQRIDSRRILGEGNLGRHGNRTLGVPAPQCEPCIQRTQRPLIPAAGQRFTVCLARLFKAAACRVVLPANQVYLGEGIEDGAGRLTHELKRTAHVQRAVQCFLRAIQIPEPDANLTEGRQRDAKTMRCARFLLQFNAAFRQGERRLVPVLHERNVRLIAAHGREDVAGFNLDGQPLRLAQRGHGLVQPSFLGQRHARERVDHRKMPPVACRVQG